MRTLAMALVAGLLAAGCAPSREGPAAPIDREQVQPAPGLDAAAARRTALDFLQAYAASGTDRTQLLEIVTGEELLAWVHWLDVQNREFAGSIVGRVDLRVARFVGSAPVEGGVGAQVDIAASLDFTFRPIGGDPFHRNRILDGPLNLIRLELGEWRVADVTRDGVPMSAGIQILEGQVQERRGVTVALDSVFTFTPNWQFNLVVTNGTPDPIVLEPERSIELYVRGPGGMEPTEAVITRSLVQVPPGATVEGLAALPTQDSARGRILSVPYRTLTGELLTFAFPLAGVLSDAPEGLPTGEGAATAAPS